MNSLNATSAVNQMFYTAPNGQVSVSNFFENKLDALRVHTRPDSNYIATPGKHYGGGVLPNGNSVTFTRDEERTSLTIYPNNTRNQDPIFNIYFYDLGNKEGQNPIQQSKSTSQQELIAEIENSPHKEEILDTLQTIIKTPSLLLPSLTPQPLADD